MRVLAGDIGGTKSLLALIEINPDLPDYDIIHERTLMTKHYGSLSAVVREFLQEANSEAERACLGVACLLVNEESDAFDLPWPVKRSTLAKEIRIPNTRLINDFEAAGYGLELLGPDDLVILQKGTPEPQGPIAVMGAGTGLGQAFLMWESGGYRVHSSSGGLADFAARNDLEIEMLRSLLSRGHRVCYGRILSGNGLIQIYNYLIQSGTERENPEIRSEMEKEDVAAVISRYALAGTDGACARALDMFVSIYGAEAGNMALRVNASGGVYLAGGIAPRIIDKLRDGTFIQAFCAKGRLSPFLQGIPIQVVNNVRVGVLGAVVVAARFQ